VTAEEQRALGVELFNRAWTLMELAERTPDEDAEMLDCAHASAYHWAQVGTAANRSRSEWQCSRVYVVLGWVEPALYYAKRCHGLVQAHPEEMKDWDLPAAYEALARAHMVAGDVVETRKWAELGRAATANISDEDDRAVIEADFATIRT
jgi:hypothetical protein